MTESAHVDRFVIDRLPPDDQWPDIVAVPELTYPERLNGATELLDNALAAGWGDRACMALGDTEWTYGELADRANRLAEILVQDCGIVPGNRVLVRGPNAPWVVAAWFATLKAGAVAVLTMPLLRAAELTKIYAKCSPSVALCQPGMEAELLDAANTPVWTWGPAAERGGEIAGDLIEASRTKSGEFSNVDTAADDPALLGFTSGTTGEPKAAVHFHRDLLIVADAFLPVLKATADDVFVGSPPLAFTFGLGGEVVFPMRIGASTVFCPAPGPAALAEVIATRGATVCFTAPTAYKAMVELDPAPDLSSLRRGVSAGETLPLAVYEQVEQATGVKLIDGLGATEMLHIFIACSDDDIRPGATGKPILGFEAKIVDDDGADVADGQVGKLAVRGPIGCRYLDDDRQQTYVQNGWNLSGDAYLRDNDGYFWYQARTDDMIISSGYNIAAPEVEQALAVHPCVLEVGVIGEPDAERGSVVHAFVHLREGFDPSDELRIELQDHVKATIAPYKYPRQLTFSADPLPRTPTGKLRRSSLRADGRTTP